MAGHELGPVRVPAPVLRGRAVFGPPCRVPAGLGRAELEPYRRWFENLLNWLTDEAEVWAGDGRRRTGEAVMAPRRSSLVPDVPTAPPLPVGLATEWAALTTDRPPAVAA